MNWLCTPGARRGVEGRVLDGAEVAEARAAERSVHAAAGCLVVVLHGLRQDGALAADLCGELLNGVGDIQLTLIDEALQLVAVAVQVAFDAAGVGIGDHVHHLPRLFHDVGGHGVAVAHLVHEADALAVDHHAVDVVAHRRLVAGVLAVGHGSSTAGNAFFKSNGKSVHK